MLSPVDSATRENPVQTHVRMWAALSSPACAHSSTPHRVPEVAASINFRESRMSTRRLVRLSLAGPLLIALSVMTSCGTDAIDATEQRPDASSVSTDQNYLADNLAAMHASGRRRVLARTFAEYLPHQTFTVAGQKVGSDAEAVVLGEVVAAKVVRAFHLPGGDDADAPSGTEIAIDDPRAQWRIIELDIAVEDQIGAEVESRARAAFSVDGPDYKRLLAEAESLGSVIVVLDQPGSYDFDEGLWRVSNIGTLIGQVDENGAVTFPALGDESASFVGNLTTWDAVENEFATAKDPIVTDANGARELD